MPFPYVPISRWDALVVLAVSVQATVLAYLPQPRWKAFLLSLPVPFTLMALAAGRPLDATNLMGLFFLLLFTHGVRLLYQGFRLPILLAILLPALGYCLLGSVAARLLPKTGTAFWLTWAFVSGLGGYLTLCLPERTEPEHRTQLPVWLKLPIVAGVVLCLILVRNALQGFATVFPMVGVIAAYESRYSLWTIGRQIPVIMVSMSSMMAAAYLVQHAWGLPAALLVGWGVFLLLFGSITVRQWAKGPGPVAVPGCTE